MEIFPIKTPLLKEGDDLAQVLSMSTQFEDGDIIVVSSKAVSVTESGYMKLGSSEHAFQDAVEKEMKRMHGWIASVSPHAILSYLKPDGFGEGALLAVNAGLDNSNAPEDCAIGWPIDPPASASNLKRAFEKATGKTLAVIMSDSCCAPSRLGVTAFALVVSGIDPFQNRIGEPDLFGKKLRMTQEAIADQLATIANFVMGNSDQSIPAAVIRGHGRSLSEFSGWVPGIEPSEDLFAPLWASGSV